MPPGSGPSFCAGCSAGCATTALCSTELSTSFVIAPLPLLQLALDEGEFCTWNG
jgi:hypothetical protein